MKLIKALLHLHSKQSPGKLNYKSFIRQTSSVCILFHPFNVRLVFSPTICASVGVSCREAEREAGLKGAIFVAHDNLWLLPS